MFKPPSAALKESSNSASSQMQLTVPISTLLVTLLVLIGKDSHTTFLQTPLKAFLSLHLYQQVAQLAFPHSLFLLCLPLLVHCLFYSVSTFSSSPLDMDLPTLSC